MGLDFLISLQQKISGPANAAGNALADLQKKIKAEETELKNLEGWMKRIQGSSSVDIEQYRKVEGLIAGKKQSLLGLSEQLATTSGGLQEAAGATQGFDAKIKAIAGPLMIAVGAALAFAAAVGAVVYAVFSFVLAQAGAKRALVLSLQGITGNAQAARDLDDAIGRVAKTTPVAGDELDALGKSLATAGLRGKAFESSLKGLATVQSTVGAEASKKLEDLIKKSSAAGSFKAGAESLVGTGLAVQDLYGAIAKKMGVGIDKVEGLIKAGKVSVETGVDALNDAIQSKFGDVAGAQLLDFNTQMTKLKDSVGELFEDVKIEPFLQGLRSVTVLFDDSTASGKALKALAGKLLDGLFENASKVFPYVKAGIQGLIIAGLRLYIALYPLGKVLAPLLGFNPNSDGLDKMARTVELLAYGFAVVGAAIGAVGYVLYAVFIAPFIAAYDVVYGFISQFITGFQAAYDFIAGLDFGELATHLIDGLVGGIVGGVGKVVGAVKSLASSAISAFVTTTEIGSPSKVFRRLGVFIAQGLGLGVEDGTPNVEDSISALAAPPPVPTSSVSVAKGGNTYIFYISGVKDAEELKAPSFLQRFADAIEGLTREAAAPLGAT